MQSHFSESLEERGASMPRVAFFMVLLFVLLTLTVFIGKQRLADSASLSDALPTNGAQLSTSSLQPSTPAEKLASPEPSIMSEAELSSLRSSTFTNSSMSGVADRLTYRKEMVQQRYQDSPARNTPECQAFLNILQENGYGLEYLEPVYILADMAHIHRDENLKRPDRFLQFDHQDYDPSNPEHAKLLEKSRKFHLEHNRFKLGHLLQPSTDREGILDEILKIEPRAPYIDIYQGASIPR